MKKKAHRKISNKSKVERWNWNKSILKKTQKKFIHETGDSSYKAETNPKQRKKSESI
jgi:hypothetical protein